MTARFSFTSKVNSAAPDTLGWTPLMFGRFSLCVTLWNEKFFSSSLYALPGTKRTRSLFAVVIGARRFAIVPVRYGRTAKNSPNITPVPPFSVSPS